MQLKTYFITDADGIKREYLNFGNYPCKVITDEKLIEKLNNIDKCCRLGNSSYQYVEFQGDLYCRLNVYTWELNYFPKKEKFKPRFQCGKVIVNGTYYFKVEPIIWQVLRSDNNHLLLYSKNVLGVLPMNNYIQDINTNKATLTQLESMKNKNYQLINLYTQEIKRIRLAQSIDFQNKYEDYFTSIAFNEEELSLVVKSKEDLSFYRSQNKNIKKLIKRNSCDAIATDFARAKKCMFCAKEKNEGLAPYWYIEIDEKLNLPLIGIKNPFILHTPTADDNIGIRPIIEVCISNESIVENKKIEEEIIEKNVETINAAVEKEKYLLNKVTSICFSQIKPKPAPVFSGFIPTCLMLTIIGIPIAFIYGMIRGLIQNSKIEKYVPKENAIEIKDAQTIRLFIDGSFKEIPISSIDHYWYSRKQFNSVSLVPSTYNTKTCSYGKVIVYTKDKNKYVVDNILFPKGVIEFLEEYKYDWKIANLLNINNDQFSRIMQAISYFDSGIFNESLFKDTVSKIVDNK